MYTDLRFSDQEILDLPDKNAISGDERLISGLRPRSRTFTRIGLVTDAVLETSSSIEDAVIVTAGTEDAGDVIGSGFDRLSSTAISLTVNSK